MDHEMAGESTGACLDPDAVLEFVEGRASPELRDLVEQHASVCTSCRKTLSLLAQSRAPTQAEGTPTRLQRPGPGRSVSPFPGHSIGRYIVRDLLGAGGMGEVYVAHDPELGREVAIKLLAPALGDSEAREIFEARFRREARALARVAHPNVVAVYDVGRVEDRMFIAMELVEGETLAKWLRSERPPHQILAHFIAAGRGLAAAHAAGIVHRDVKPGNMMLGNDGRVRVVDFGLARAPLEEKTLTLAGAVMGTPHYMAPEQHRGDEADARSDQFSFCVALYAALYGQFPFEGTDPIALARAVMAGELREPPRRRDVPGRIGQALRRGMSVAPEDRFATLEELLAQLAPEPPRRRLSAVRTIGLGVAVAGGIIAAVLIAQSRATPASAAPADAARPPPVTPAIAPPPPVDAAAPADADAAPPPHTPHHVRPPRHVHVGDVPIDRGD